MKRHGPAAGPGVTVTGMPGVPEAAAEDAWVASAVRWHSCLRPLRRHRRRANIDCSPKADGPVSNAEQSSCGAIDVGGNWPPANTPTPSPTISARVSPSLGPAGGPQVP